MADTEQLNKKCIELKKRIQLFEGQKRANSEEWEKLKNHNNETISLLKREIKELKLQLKLLQNSRKCPFVKDHQEVTTNTIPLQFLMNIKNASEGVIKIDLKIIDTQKQLDLLHDKYFRRQQFFNKLIEEYNELQAYKKNNQNQNYGIENIPSETLDEDIRKKLACHLENEIHRIKVQWMEAEHIQKKYRLIQSSLMADSEKFDKSLKELEDALTEQQAEIHRLQKIHKESITMRDLAKIIVQRQEQQINVFNETREKQTLEFRRQVEERKLELERIEREIFSSGKTLVHQDSNESNSADQINSKYDDNDDPNILIKLKANQLEIIFKEWMKITGATNIYEVLQRFQSQNESTKRLSYLRIAAEEEKKNLEQKRELFINELENSKFHNISENEINQEELEKLKVEINELKKQVQDNIENNAQINKVIKSIYDTLIEIILKLQEINDESNGMDLLNEELQAEYLINVLEQKMQTYLEISKEESDNVQSNEDDYEDILPSIVMDEKQTQLLPSCYIHLISGRATQSSSASPGQITQQAAVTEDENEIPSRNFLKQQALLIVDTKSRRKGFRPTAQRRK